MRVKFPLSAAITFYIVYFQFLRINGDVSIIQEAFVSPNGNSRQMLNEKFAPGVVPLSDVSYFKKALDLAMKEAYRFFPGFDHAYHHDITIKKAAAWKELKAQKHRFKEAEAFEQSSLPSDYADADSTELSQAVELSSPQPTASPDLKFLPPPLANVERKLEPVVVLKPSTMSDRIALDNLNSKIRPKVTPESTLPFNGTSGRQERRRRKPDMGRMERSVPHNGSLDLNANGTEQRSVVHRASPPPLTVKDVPKSDSSSERRMEDARPDEERLWLGYKEETITTSDILIAVGGVMLLFLTAVVCIRLGGSLLDGDREEQDHKKTHR